MYILDVTHGLKGKNGAVLSPLHAAHLCTFTFLAWTRRKLILTRREISIIYSRHEPNFAACAAVVICRVIMEHYQRA